MAIHYLYDCLTFITLLLTLIQHIGLLSTDILQILKYHVKHGDLELDSFTNSVLDVFYRVFVY